NRKLDLVHIVLSAPPDLEHSEFLKIDPAVWLPSQSQRAPLGKCLNLWRSRGWSVVDQDGAVHRCREKFSIKPAGEASRMSRDRQLPREIVVSVGNGVAVEPDNGIRSAVGAEFSVDIKSYRRRCAPSGDRRIPEANGSPGLKRVHTIPQRYCH